MFEARRWCCSSMSDIKFISAVFLFSAVVEFNNNILLYIFLHTSSHSEREHMIFLCLVCISYMAHKHRFINYRKWRQKVVELFITSHIWLLWKKGVCFFIILFFFRVLSGFFSLTKYFDKEFWVPLVFCLSYVKWCREEITKKVVKFHSRCY